MSSDKRTVSTDALETLGMIHTRDEKRDAIHLAVIPVTAGSNLEPGDHVYLDGDGMAVKFYEDESKAEPLGIVDPFIKRVYRNGVSYGTIKPGQRFWLVIYPRVITSLRHVWTHPALPDEMTALQTQVNDAREESRKWLEGFAARLFSYEPSNWDTGEPTSRLDVLLEGAEHGGFGTDIEYGEGTKPDAEFWMHYERYTGRKVATKHEYFRCAC